MSLIDVRVRSKRFPSYRPGAGDRRDQPGARSPAGVLGGSSVSGGVATAGVVEAAVALDGNEPVLADIHFQLAEGELVGLVGASGCGKSTLLRIVAGLDSGYDGQVLLDGRPLRGPSRDIGVVFQEPRLFPWLTVSENVAFDLGQGRDEAWARRLLAEVGLQGLENAWPKQLSGGQAQRVAIARALYTRPRLLLLDEPFSALDAFTRMKLQDLVLSLARAHGTGLLLVTHDVEEAVLLSDRVLVLGSAPGRVLWELGVPLRHPRQRGSAAVADLRAELLRTLETTVA